MGVSLLEEVEKAENEMKEALSCREEDNEFVAQFDEIKERKTEVDDEMENLRVEERDVLAFVSFREREF